MSKRFELRVDEVYKGQVFYSWLVSPESPHWGSLMKLASGEGKSGLVAVLHRLSTSVLRLLGRDRLTEPAKHGAASCKGAALAADFNRSVSCYGRTYVVQTQAEFDELIGWLNTRQLALANRYRVGASWPRGKRAVKVLDGSLWQCQDCGRAHRAWTLKCPISQRERALAASALPEDGR